MQQVHSTCSQKPCCCTREQAIVVLARTRAIESAHVFNLQRNDRQQVKYLTGRQQHSSAYIHTHFSRFEKCLSCERISSKSCTTLFSTAQISVRALVNITWSGWVNIDGAQGGSSSSSFKSCGRRRGSSSAAGENQLERAHPFSSPSLLINSPPADLENLKFNSVFRWLSKHAPYFEISPARDCSLLWGIETDAHGEASSWAVNVYLSPSSFVGEFLLAIARTRAVYVCSASLCARAREFTRDVVVCVYKTLYSLSL